MSNPTTSPGMLDIKSSMFRVNREVPMWSILSALVGFGIAFGSLWFGQQEQVREMVRWNSRQAEMQQDIRALLGEVRQSSMEQAKLNYQINNMEQRLRLAEDQLRRIPPK